MPDSKSPALYNPPMRSLALFSLMWVTACSPDVAFTPAQRLAGSWTCTMDGALLVLNANGTCSMRSSTAAGLTTTPGTFEATWTTISFLDETGGCADISARYTYLLSRDSLLLSQGSDPCEPRAIRSEYAWVRVLEPALPAVEQGELEAAATPE